MSAAREMNLQEWVETLPSYHLARKEYEALVATPSTDGGREVVDFAEAEEHAKGIEAPLPPRYGEEPAYMCPQRAAYNLARAYLALRTAQPSTYTSAEQRDAVARLRDIAASTEHEETVLTRDLHILLAHPATPVAVSEASIEAAWKEAYRAIGAGEVNLPPNKWARAFAAALAASPTEVRDAL
jgi:hypothetical protein